jgi:putative heme degradation protein
MTDAKAIREALACSVAAAVEATRGMGRVMLSVSDKGATHERIGVVDTVTVEPDAVALSGSAHDSRIDLKVIRGVVADRSAKMKDRVLPRLEFQDAGGTTLFSIIGLDGIEPFDTALESIGAGSPLPEKERPAPPAGGNPPAEIDPEDIGAKPLHAAKDSGTTIGVVYRGNGLEQRWTGTVAEVRPAMGFINIIQPDFHLHLKAGAVARWRREDNGAGVALHAEDAEGQPLGLILTGPASLA